MVLTFKAVLSKNLTGDDTKGVVESGHGEHGQHLPCQGPEVHVLNIKSHKNSRCLVNPNHTK